MNLSSIKSAQRPMEQKYSDCTCHVIGHLYIQMILKTLGLTYSQSITSCLSFNEEPGKTETVSFEIYLWSSFPTLHVIWNMIGKYVCHKLILSVPWAPTFTSHQIILIHVTCNQNLTCLQLLYFPESNNWNTLIHNIIDSPKIFDHYDCRYHSTFVTWTPQRTKIGPLLDVPNNLV